MLRGRRKARDQAIMRSLAKGRPGEESKMLLPAVRGDLRTLHQI